MLTSAANKSELFGELKPDNIPAALCMQKRWAPWEAVWNEKRQKWDKVPRHALHTERKLSTASPANWFTFEQAYAAFLKHSNLFAGIGYVLTGSTGLVGIDIDGCLDPQTKEPNALARDILARAHSYAEVSPSGTGLRIFVKGQTAGDFNDHSVGLEVYQGDSPRFLTVTGAQVTGTPSTLEPASPELLAHLETYRKASTKAATTDAELPDFAEIDGEATLARVAADLAPDMVNELRGLEPLTGDGSRRVAHMAICLRKVGLSEAECMAVLVGHPGPFDMALGHRRQDAARATEYLWQHHVRTAWAEPSAAHVPVEFEPVEDTDAPDTGKPLELAPITLEELNAAKLSPRALVPGLLYADLRVRIAAGGVGKTTLALFEAVTVALGRPLWGFATPTALRTVIVTREDSRGILVARLREVAREMRLQPAEVAQVLAHVNILDLSAANFRLSKVERDVVTPDRANIGRLVATLSPFRPDWVIFDPAVSFGVGEARVNDAEQGLIEALRIVREALDCCCELIHHSGKANARAGTADQYSGRGGSAMPDGARMVAVLNPVTPEDWVKAVGSPLAQGETGLAMSLPKMSYAPAIAEPVYIRRRGWHFARAAATAQTPEQAVQNDAGRVADFLRAELAQGRKYSATSLDACTEQIGLARSKLRAALTRLKASGGVTVVGGQGKEDSFLRPAEVVATSADFTGRSSEDLGVEDAPN